MQIGSTQIKDTFAEAFEMKFVRLIVTAMDREWLDAAVREATGYSASVIGCDAEAGVDRYLEPTETIDGRPGAALLFFGRSTSDLQEAIINRVGQCIMTCPTTAVFDGSDEACEKRIPLGRSLRYFGDGYQQSKIVGTTRYWRVPVMDGEFVVVDKVGVDRGVAGGNLIIESVDAQSGLASARRAATAVNETAGVMSPFPGGVVRSGSKVGSRYKGLIASTSDGYCPTLRGRVETELEESTHCVYEIVIDGVTEQAVGQAMLGAMQAAAGEGVVAIGAGNYGGKLGKFHFHLRKLASRSS